MLKVFGYLDPPAFIDMKVTGMSQVMYNKTVFSKIDFLDF